MYQISQEYIEALESGAVQHIRGILTDVYGAETVLDDDTMVGNPSIDLRCVEDEEVFMVGQMYTGELSIILNVPSLRRDELLGGEIKLWFSVEGAEDEVPLGVFDISSAERETGGRLTIKALDHINRLDAAIDDSTVGAVFASIALSTVEEVAGVEFAQTIDEINALLPTDSYGRKIDIKYGYFGTHFLTTCRDEVRAIAQLIGGFAFANREGKIEFRRFGKTSVRTIPATLRKSIKLSEYNYGVRGFSYTGSLGHTVFEPSSGQGQSTTVLSIEDNKYLPDREKNYKTLFDTLLYPLCHYFTGVRWVPGTIEYYGDPAFDLGDMITLEGGITDSEDCNFLICSSYWQFRAPQQLTAPGVPQAGSSTVSSSGSSGTGASGTQINITKTIETVELNEYPQCIDVSTTIADGAVTARDAAWAFLHYSINLLGAEDCTVSITAYLDGEEIVFPEVFVLASGEYRSAERTVPVMLSAGEHIFRVELETDHLQLRDDQRTLLFDNDHTALYPAAANRSINIDDVSAQAWGQNIVGNTEGGTGVSYIQDILGELVETSSPETIISLLTALDEQRNTLAEILTSRGVEADASEKLNTLVQKVSQIKTGGNEPAQAFVLGNSAGNSVIGNAEELEV